MFGIGMPELVLIFVLALLVFGPKELPKIARTLGKTMAELRRASDELRDGIQREIELAEREENPSAPPVVAPPITPSEATPPAAEMAPHESTAATPGEGSGSPPGSVAAETPAGEPPTASREQSSEAPSAEMVTPNVTPVATGTDGPKDGQKVPGDHHPEAQTASTAPTRPAETRNA